MAGTAPPARVYANYAATSPRLSAGAASEVRAYLEGDRLSAGRSFEGLEECAIALRARRAVARLFGVENPLRVIFASGATAALNMAIHGLFRAGCHALATGVEHNAAARPLEALRGRGLIDLEWLPCEPDGSLDPARVRRALRKTTRLLVMTHASNVLGTILPVRECFAIAREHGVLTVLDMAQTGGALPWRVDDACDAAVFAGHKGLGALPGTGGLVLGEAASRLMRPWMAGGTGSASDSLDMPGFLPDRFEPGTPNTPGILSLAASVEEIVNAGCETIRGRERALTARFLAGLRDIPGISVHGPRDAARSMPVVSVTARDWDPGDLSRRLFERHGVITRSGLHCSPLAHKTAGTFPGGTVRFSFGRETAEAEIDAILAALAAP